MTNDKNFDFNDDQYHRASTKPEDTKKEWNKILMLCEKKVHIGFGLLDSFLSGPDIERRTKLIKDEIKNNNWLRNELMDTVQISSSSNPTDDELIEAIKIIS
jgi:hypothetical protein